MLWARLGEKSFTVAISLGEKGTSYNIGEVKRGLVNKRRNTEGGKDLRANGDCDQAVTQLTVIKTCFFLLKK